MLVVVLLESLVGGQEIACTEGNCIECEKIVLDKQLRMLSFCQYRDDSATGFRIGENSEIYENGAGSMSLAPDGGVKVYSQKPKIKECMFNTTFTHMRNEDFVDMVQALINSGVPAHCESLSEVLCHKFGTGVAQTEIPTSQCCALSSLAYSWTLSNPLLFQCKCASGYRRDAEQCDDGNLLFGDPQTGEFISKNNDGCNKFCEIETDFGWSCVRFPDKLDGSPAPDICTCSCVCTQKCTCQDFEQRQYCAVDVFGNKDGKRCCAPL